MWNTREEEGVRGKRGRMSDEERRGGRGGVGKREDGGERREQIGDRREDRGERREERGERI